MATKEEYAYFCTQLMEGDTYMIEDLYKALRGDGLVNSQDEWIYEDE